MNSSNVEEWDEAFALLMTSRNSRCVLPRFHLRTERFLAVQKPLWIDAPILKVNGAVSVVHGSCTHTDYIDARSETALPAIVPSDKEQMPEVHSFHR
jgi:hypothetical protein